MHFLQLVTWRSSALPSVRCHQHPTTRFVALSSPTGDPRPRDLAAALLAGRARRAPPTAARPGERSALSRVPCACALRAPPSVPPCAVHCWRRGLSWGPEAPSPLACCTSRRLSCCILTPLHLPRSPPPLPSTGRLPLAACCARWSKRTGKKVSFHKVQERKTLELHSYRAQMPKVFYTE